MKSKPREKTTETTKTPNHPPQRHWHEMNRKQRREMMREIQSEDVSLEVLHTGAFSYIYSLVSGEKLVSAGNLLSMKSLQQLESGTI